MTWEDIRANWQGLAACLARRLSMARLDDLQALEGDRTRVLAYLCERGEMTAREAEALLDELLAETTAPGR